MRRLQSRYVEILDAFAERVEKGVKGCKDMDQKPPHSVGERERLYRWALRFDSSLEISNKLGDILFLIFALRDHKVLFWMSLAALGLALLLRILIGLKSWPRVGHDEKKKWTYASGMLVTVVEPLAGSRMISDSFKDTDAIQSNSRWDATQRKFVRERDPYATRAHNKLEKAKALMQLSFVMVVVEDW